MSLQHVICTFARYDGNLEQFKKELPYCILPDAIRGYLGNRVLSHFEDNPEHTDSSWYKYPSDIKNLTKDKALMQESHQAETNLHSVIGEKSDFGNYVRINRDLPRDEFYGILTHLVQDLIYDSTLKVLFDMSHKYGEDAYFQERETGKKYSGKEFRELLADMEVYGYYYLARYCHIVYGIDINQEWLDENVYSTLLDAYPKDLADTTYKYMQLPAWLDEKITNRDYSGLNNTKRNQEYDVIYSMIMNYTKDLTFFHEWKGHDNPEPPKQRAA